MIRPGDGGQIEEICFASHLTDILDIEPTIMPGDYAAYRRLRQMARGPPYLLTLKLRAGEIAMFDNCRVLHDRAALNPSTGFSHLRGCYAGRGEFGSRMRALARATARSEPACRYGRAPRAPFRRDGRRRSSVHQSPHV